MTSISATSILPYRDLIDSALWDRLVNGVKYTPEFRGVLGAQDEASQTEWAERIMNETLGFLLACANHPGKEFAPSLLVDAGWHTFMLISQEYTQFCERVAGCYLHHDPMDTVEDAQASVPLRVEAMEAMRALSGIDEALWGATDDPVCNNSCSGCAGDCRWSGVPG